MKTPKLSSDFEPAVAHLEATLRGIRTGRASVGLVESLTAEYYGTPTRLRDMASLSLPDPRTIQIEPWDAAAVDLVEKALLASSLGVTPSKVGKVLRLHLPALTEDRRQELTKLVGKYVEDARIAVRNTREKLLRDLKHRHDDGELSDTAFELEKKQLQRQVDDTLAVIEEHGKEKEAELLGVS